MKDKTNREIEKLIVQGPNFSVSMRFLRLREQETQNKIAHFNRGCAPALQEKKFWKYNSHILALKKSLTLGNRSVDSYWDTMAQLCKTI